uniref:Monoglyceride lipase-like n=1 Tax=Phallusia mammillata TaxID=59560 RepID=A0A6F9DK48_9ASCI|nr:monoglyceride lipase-like [Phallusia mammillata]
MSSETSVNANDNASARKTFSGKTFAEVDHFINASNDYIFCKYWKPAGEPRALILIIHGFGEHSGRYSIMAPKFTELGFLVFSNDHYCHGESDGYRLDIADYQVFLRDLKQHCSIMKEKYPNLPLFVLGHSMGGALACLFVHQNPDLAKHVVLSSPMIAKNKELTRTKLFLMRLFSSTFPHMPVGSLDTKLISRDMQQVKKYDTDPLVYHNKVLLRTAISISELFDDTEKILPEITFSFFVLHGDRDGMCDVSGSKMLHELAKSTDKTIKIFPGGYHELVHDIEPTSSEYASCIVDWLKERLPKC